MKKLFRIIPFRVAAAYLVFAGCWIYFSGKVVHQLTQDHNVIEIIETYKGFAFVLVTTILLYLDLRKRLRQLEREQEERLAVQKELTEQEIKYRNLFENSPNAVFVNVNDRVTLVNRACLDLFGAGKPEELIGKSPYDLFHPDFHDTVRQRIRALRGKGRAVPEIEERIVRLDGRAVDVVAQAAPFLFGETRAIHVILRDVTERKRQEAELRLRNERLAALYALSTEMRKAESSGELLALVLKRVVKLLNADAGTVSLLTADKQHLVIEASHKKSMVPVGTRYPAHAGLSGFVLEKDRPFKTDDCSEEPRFLDLGNAAHMGPAIYLPFHSEREKMGVMAIVRLKRAGVVPFTQADLELGDTISELVGNTLRRLLLYEQSERRLNQTQALRRIDLAILNNPGLGSVLRVALKEVQNQIRVSTAMVRAPSLEGAGYACIAKAGIPKRTDCSSLAISPDDGLLKALRNKSMLTLPDISQAGFASPYLEQVRKHGLHFYTAVPIRDGRSLSGMLEIFNPAPLILLEEEKSFLHAFADQVAIAIENASLWKNLTNANQSLIQTYDTTIEGWSRALDMRDKETEGHTLRVTEMTLNLARRMSIPEEELVHIRRGALLHDIGKLGVPDHILLKPDALSEEEWKIMRQHPQFAYDMLSFIEYLRPALDIPYCHHEKWDGSGYPRGLAGEHIPKAARIFSVVDVWDALSSDRPYRPAWPKEKILAHIRSLSGTHFDPRVVVAFFEFMRGQTNTGAK